MLDLLSCTVESPHDDRLLKSSHSSAVTAVAAITAAVTINTG